MQWGALMPAIFQLKQLYFLFFLVTCIACTNDLEKERKILNNNQDHECNGLHIHTAEHGATSFSITQMPADFDKTSAGLPKLESNPKAKVALYLDFDGGTYYGYDDIYGAADLDGKPQSYSNSEANKIYTAYLHVVKAFAPFDVNVTTVEEKARSAEKWAWIIISDDYSKTGGKGKIGIFDSSSYNKGRPKKATSLAGAQAVLNPRNHEIGYLLVHELGHNFGLNHAGRYKNGKFEEYSDFHNGPVGAFMGGRGSQFDEYEWMSLKIEGNKNQNSMKIISDITGPAKTSNSDSNDPDSDDPVDPDNPDSDDPVDPDNPDSDNPDSNDPVDPDNPDSDDPDSDNPANSDNPADSDSNNSTNSNSSDATNSDSDETVDSEDNQCQPIGIKLFLDSR